MSGEQGKGGGRAIVLTGVAIVLVIVAAIVVWQIAEDDDGGGASSEPAAASQESVSADRAETTVEETVKKPAPAPKTKEPASQEGGVPTNTMYFIGSSPSAAAVAACETVIEKRYDRRCGLIVLRAEGKIRAGSFTTDEANALIRRLG